MRSRFLIRAFAALLPVALIFFASSAGAKVFLKPGLMYLKDSDDNNGSKATTVRTLVDMGLDYSFDKGGWTLGVLYGTETSRTETQTQSFGSSSTSITEATRASFGPSLGWVFPKDGNGPYLLGTYFITSDYKEGTTIYKGTGYQATLGARFKASRAFLAVELNYKSFEYKRSVTGTFTADVNPPRRQTYIDPGFSAFFEF
jgi:hypothetical protein